MQSTGKEKFTVYVYYKTKAYKQEEAHLWKADEEDYCENNDNKEIQHEEEEEVKKPDIIAKQDSEPVDNKEKA